MYITNNKTNFTSVRKPNTVKSAEERKKEEEYFLRNLIEYNENDPHYRYLREDNSFNGTARKRNKKSRKTARNYIVGALLTVSTLGAPLAYGVYSENAENEKLMAITSTNPYQVKTKEDSLIVERAEELAKGGKRDDVLELQEFTELLDYKNLEGLPKTTREAIKIASRSMFIPININAQGAQEEILKHVKETQHLMDDSSEKLKTNPTQTSMEGYLEYAINNITDREILENVDLTDLAYYQYDLTLVKHMINASRERIKRNDPKAEAKKQKAIEDAQKFVDGIVKDYETRAKVNGNYNGDEKLSKGELATLLNMAPLEGLPEIVRIGIISKALEKYKPLDLRYAKTDNQVEMANKNIEKEKEKSQAILNDWAARARKEFYSIANNGTLVNSDIEHQNK